MQITIGLRPAVTVLGVLIWLIFNYAFAQSSDVTRRTALVFGNAAYSAPDRALKNPVSDARLMARTLKELGFNVRLREDVDRRAMLQALREFEDTLRKTKGIGFLYFAGHGVQVNGRNYIVPIGANLVRDVDVLNHAIDIDAVLQSLRDTGSTLNILVLDACRNNPLLATTRSAGGSSVKTGLAPMRPPEGALVAFATEPGRLASDGNEVGNGLYTRHLARWLKEPNLTLEQVFKRTREAVQTESKGDQIPTEYSVLIGADLYLAGIGTEGGKVPKLPFVKGSASEGRGEGRQMGAASAMRSVEQAAPPWAAIETEKLPHAVLADSPIQALARLGFTTNAADACRAISSGNEASLKLFTVAGYKNLSITLPLGGGTSGLCLEELLIGQGRSVPLDKVLLHFSLVPSELNSLYISQYLGTGSRGFEDVVALGRSVGLDVNLRVQLLEIRATPLMFAIWGDNLNATEALLSQDLNPNYQSQIILGVDKKVSYGSTGTYTTTKYFKVSLSPLAEAERLNRNAIKAILVKRGAKATTSTSEYPG